MLVVNVLALVFIKFESKKPIFLLQVYYHFLYYVFVLLSKYYKTKQ